MSDIYNIWLEYTGNAAKQKLWKLEECGVFILFKLTTDDDHAKNGGFSSVTYHIWNRETGEHEVHMDYRQAYNAYKTKIGG